MDDNKVEYLSNVGWSLTLSNLTVEAFEEVLTPNNIYVLNRDEILYLINKRLPEEHRIIPAKFFKFLKDNVPPEVKYSELYQKVRDIICDSVISAKMTLMAKYMETTDYKTMRKCEKVLDIKMLEWGVQMQQENDTRNTGNNGVIVNILPPTNLRPPTKSEDAIILQDIEDAANNYGLITEDTDVSN